MSQEEKEIIIDEQAESIAAMAEAEQPVTEGDYVPDLQAEASQKEQAQAEELAAKQGAVMAVSLVETVVKMRWAFVEIGEEQKTAIIEKATPVMRKYGADLPEFLKPYREEIELGMVVAATGFGVFMQVKAHEQANDSDGETKEETAP